MAEGTGPLPLPVSESELGALKPSEPLLAKRRQSSDHESVSKRPRLSDDHSIDSPPTIGESPRPIHDELDAVKLPEKLKNIGPDRRRSSAQEERKRGQRLFGGLLSTLSQSTPNGQQKRRLEIEKRQQEKAKQQKVDDEVRRSQKIAELKVIRKAEQVKFDEQSMRIRHSNMLAMANFLCTKTKPKLYYKPWELLPQDEERIKLQIAEAEALIRQEADDFNAQNLKEIKGEPSTDNANIIKSEETVGERRAESSSVSKVTDATNFSPLQVIQSDQVQSEKQALEEHSGEVVVENEEDTVIY